MKVGQTCLGNTHEVPCWVNSAHVAGWKESSAHVAGWWVYSAHVAGGGSFARVIESISWWKLSKNTGCERV